MILGIDIGGTTVKLGLVDREGRIHAQTEVSVCFDGILDAKSMRGKIGQVVGCTASCD